MGTMATLIEQVSQELEEADASPLMRVAMGLMLAGKTSGKGSAKQRIAAAATAWSGVVDAAKAMARLTERGELMADGRSRRFLAFLFRELEGALHATGAAEEAIGGGPTSQPPAAAQA